MMRKKRFEPGDHVIHYADIRNFMTYGYPPQITIVLKEDETKKDVYETWEFEQPERKGMGKTSYEERELVPLEDFVSLEGDKQRMIDYLVNAGYYERDYLEQTVAYWASKLEEEKLIGKIKL